MKSSYGLNANPDVDVIDTTDVTPTDVKPIDSALLDEGDSQIAETQARTVGGVFSVTNNLRIDQEQSADRKK